MHSDGQFWLYTVHPLYGESRCNPVLSLWVVTKAFYLNRNGNTFLLQAGNQRWTYDIHPCSDPKRKDNIGGRETFGRWTNLVFFSIVWPFVPFNYGERKSRKQYSSSFVLSMYQMELEKTEKRRIYNVMRFGSVLKKRPNKCFILRRRYHFLKEEKTDIWDLSIPTWSWCPPWQSCVIDELPGWSCQ